GRVRGAEMNRLYAVESTPTPTGAKADHRLPAQAAAVAAFARALATELKVPSPPGPLAEDRRWVAAVAKDLQAHRGGSVVIVGDGQPPAVHALAHAMNHALGNVGRTVFHTDPVEARPVDQAASLRELADDMNAGRVEFLLILGGNPGFTAPADLEFEKALLAL